MVARHSRNSFRDDIDIQIDTLVISVKIYALVLIGVNQIWLATFFELPDPIAP